MTYESMIQPVLWAITSSVALLYFVKSIRARKPKSGKNVRPLVMRGIVATAIAMLIVPAISFVPAGHRGVIYSGWGGINLSERGEGITLLVPWIQYKRDVSVRTQKVFSDQVYAQSLDLQEITAVTSVNFHVEPNKAADLYRNIGLDYKNTVIQPALFQRTKAAIGQIRAEDFAANRGILAKTVQDQLIEQLSSYGIVVEFVNIEDAIFDPAFVAAVKAKVIAEQVAAEQVRLIEAEAAKKEQVIIQAEARARSVFVEAQAQAEANILLSKSLTTDLLQWRWLTSWDGILPTTLVGKNDAALLLDASGKPGA